MGLFLEMQIKEGTGKAILSCRNWEARCHAQKGWYYTRVQIQIKMRKYIRLDCSMILLNN